MAFEEGLKLSVQVVETRKRALGEGRGGRFDVGQHGQPYVEISQIKKWKRRPEEVKGQAIEIIKKRSLK